MSTGSASALPLKSAADSLALLASLTDAVAHTVNGAAVAIGRPISGVIFELDVTAAATLAGDTLDVKVQTQLDSALAAPNWTDVVHFTQVLGNGGAKRIFAKVVGPIAEAMFEDHANGLAAGSIKNLLGDSYRVTYTIVGTGSFTFSVHATPC